MNTTPNDLRPIVPNPASERDAQNFVGRQAESERALSMLTSKRNILLNDPRRMGKTFWLVAFAEQLAQANQFRVVRIDYQGVETTKEFLLRTVYYLRAASHLPKRYLSYLKGLFDNIDDDDSATPITLKRTLDAIEPLPIFEQLLTQLSREADRTNETPIVMILDEFTDALLNITRSGRAHESRNILQRLRYLRHHTPGLRWILAGSVGFHHCWTACGAGEDVSDNLDPLLFGPLAAADAALLTRCLALGIGRPIYDSAIEEMVKLSGGMPWLIQKISDLLRFEGYEAKLGRDITAQEVRDRYDAFIADDDQSHDVTHVVQRITQFYSADEADLAFAMLDWAAEDPPQWRNLADMPAEMRLADQFVPVFQNLIHDHYLLVNHSSTEARWRYDFLCAIYLRRRLLLKSDVIAVPPMSKGNRLLTRTRTAFAFRSKGQ